MIKAQPAMLRSDRPPEVRAAGNPVPVRDKERHQHGVKLVEEHHHDIPRPWWRSFMGIHVHQPLLRWFPVTFIASKIRAPLTWSASCWLPFTHHSERKDTPKLCQTRQSCQSSSRPIHTCVELRHFLARAATAPNLPAQSKPPTWYETLKIVGTALAGGKQRSDQV